MDGGHAVGLFGRSVCCACICSQWGALLCEHRMLAVALHIRSAHLLCVYLLLALLLPVQKRKWNAGASSFCSGFQCSVQGFNLFYRSLLLSQQGCRGHGHFLKSRHLFLFRIFQEM